MQRYVIKFFKKAYELINPNYARNRRMTELRELEGMCTSEIHRRFKITRKGNF